MTATVTVDSARIAAEVDAGELARLLGMPRHRPLEGLIAERAEWARAWYAANGRPYLATRRHRIVSITDEVVSLGGGLRLAGRALVARLRAHDAVGIVGIAASAGEEVDHAALEMWHTDRPDESYFLELFAVAVVERLVLTATLTSCQAAESNGETITPHLSPGCGDWELAEQHALWAAIFPDGATGPIRLLPSGGLAPKNSILAAAGLTRQPVAISVLDACRSCRLERCRFRRAPYESKR